MNPRVWGTIEPVELPLYDVVAKVGRMLPLVRKDLITAIEAAAVLDESRGREGHGSETGATTAILRQSLSLTLALTLARLFEFGVSRRYRQDARDVASLPFLLRFLNEPEVQDYYASLARDWSTPDLGDENEQAARDYFSEAFATLSQLERDGAAIAALAELDRLRDTALAHTVIGEGGSLDDRPTRGVDFKVLLPYACAVFSLIETAVSGMDSDLPQIREQNRAAARLFWRHALGGL